ncbi:MAG: NAD-binding oxidoreductase [Deltaproteobacteria bacterium]|nr:NAD-binding oxidoreductase [Deltaproteobacteria bacterium]
MRKKSLTSAALLTEKIRETPQAFHFVFTIEDGKVGKSFTRPGQYTVISIPSGNENYFAMSSSPREPTWSFLIKAGAPLTNVLVTMNPGDAVTVTSARGGGFRMGTGHGKNILLFAAGTGIAPLRSALRWIMEKRQDYGDVTLFYGARNPDEFAYAHEFSDWKNGGVEIIQTVSNQAHPAWKGLFGHVQRHIADSCKTENTIALVCGMEGMVRDVSDRLKALGLPQNRILTNY